MQSEEEELELVSVRFCLKGVTKDLESTNSLKCLYLTSVPFVTQFFLLLLNTIQALLITEPFWYYRVHPIFLLIVVYLDPFCLLEGTLEQSL